MNYNPTSSVGVITKRVRSTLQGTFHSEATKLRFEKAQLANATDELQKPISFWNSNLNFDFKIQIQGPLLLIGRSRMQAKVWAHMNNLRAEEYKYLDKHTLSPQEYAVVIALVGYRVRYHSRELLEFYGDRLLILELPFELG